MYNEKSYPYSKLAGYGLMPNDARVAFGDTVRGLGSTSKYRVMGTKASRACPEICGAKACWFVTIALKHVSWEKADDDLGHEELLWSYQMGLVEEFLPGGDPSSAC